jgi:hypothetical protein
MVSFGTIGIYSFLVEIQIIKKRKRLLKRLNFECIKNKIIIKEGVSSCKIMKIKEM